MDNDTKKENGTKVGLDDYLCNHSIDEFNQLPRIAFDNFDISLRDILENVIQEYPYPFEVLPEKLQEVIHEEAEALSVESEVIAHIKLILISGAIGNSTRISPKPKHVENIQLWGIVIGETGTAKTPAINQSIEPIQDKDSEAYEKYKKELKEYESHLKESKEKTKGSTTPSGGIIYRKCPVYCQYIINDSTPEANIDAFRNQPRGLILHRDEFSGLINGLNQYKKNKGTDKEHYLEIYNCKPITINRVTTGVKHANNTGLANIGGLTPSNIPKIFSKDDIDDGFLPRFIFIYADKKSPYSDKSISEASENYWKTVIDYCYSIPLSIDEKTGRVKPIILTLNKEAFELYRSFRNEYDQMRELIQRRIGSFLPKLVSYCLKFAGILHILKAFDLGNGVEVNTVIEAQTIKDAIKLTRFYTFQANKLVNLYERMELQPHQKRLIEVLYKLKDEVKNGRLYLKRITETYNYGLPEYLTFFDERHIGLILRDELHLETKLSHTSYLIWDGIELKKYFKLISKTSKGNNSNSNKNTYRDISKLSKVSKQDDDLEYDSIPEVEFAEEVKTNV